jgi:hypothetical protein
MQVIGSRSSDVFVDQWLWYVVMTVSMKKKNLKIPFKKSYLKFEKLINIF